MLNPKLVVANPLVLLVPTPSQLDHHRLFQLDPYRDGFQCWQLLSNGAQTNLDHVNLPLKALLQDRLGDCFDCRRSRRGKLARVLSPISRPMLSLTSRADIVSLSSFFRWLERIKVGSSAESGGNDSYAS